MPKIRDEGQKTPSNAFKHVYDRQTEFQNQDKLSKHKSSSKDHRNALKFEKLSKMSQSRN